MSKWIFQKTSTDQQKEILVQTRGHGNIGYCNNHIERKMKARPRDKKSKEIAESQVIWSQKSNLIVQKQLENEWISSQNN